jgi:hypothetical protein
MSMGLEKTPLIKHRLVRGSANRFGCSRDVGHDARFDGSSSERCRVIIPCPDNHKG